MVPGAEPPPAAAEPDDGELLADEGVETGSVVSVVWPALLVVVRTVVAVEETCESCS